MAGDIVVVLSDLHMGAGRFVEGNALEDFTSDAALAALLKSVARESETSGRAAQLVINGDFGEFLQAPARDIFSPRQVFAPEDYRDMGETASAQRLRLIAAGHPDVFNALRAWLRAEEPRRTLVITKGNHDPQWQWPAVQTFMRQAIAAGGERAPLLEFPAAGYARPGLYIEHGNQYSETANRFQNFAAPYAPGDLKQLETPWGSRFVIEFFNFVERDRYYVDGIKPYTALIWYALKYDPAFAFRAFAALLRAAPRLVGVRDEIMDSWLTNLQTHSEAAARRYQDEAEYRNEMNMVVAHALSEINPGGREPQTDTGEVDLMQLALQSMQAQAENLAQAADQLARKLQVWYVLFGHTHRPVDIVLPSGAHYINTGTWTWLLDLTSEEQARDLFAHPDAYASRRRLTYARVDYDDNGRPQARLLEYVQPAPAPIETPPPKAPSILQSIIEFIRGLFGR
jgi:UDP-2,3-diacylglucosamine pyrophosphatase LpxH